MDIQKGQKIKLQDISASTNIDVEIDVEMMNGDVDITCFGVDSKNNLSDDRYFIFYNQLNSPENALILKQNGHCFRFKINLDILPNTIEKLIFTVTNNENLTMKNIKKGTLKLLADNQVKLQYSFDGSIFENQKAIILNELYKKSGLWRISVVSNGFDGGLSTLLAFFGGEEEITNSSKPLEDKTQPISNPPKKIETKQAKISLTKPGDSHKIDLTKNNETIHVNLNWNQKTDVKKSFFSFNQNIDLDLACMYRLKDGSKGVIQALGKAFGSDKNLPFIKLDKDDRTGSSSNGENMFFTKPELIDFAIVFAYIYEGIPSWKNSNAIVVLHQKNMPNIEIQLDSTNKNQRFCVIASMKNINGNLQIKREEQYFNGHKEVDHHYGFGFRWTIGSK